MKKKHAPDCFCQYKHRIAFVSIKEKRPEKSGTEISIGLPWISTGRHRMWEWVKSLSVGSFDQKQASVEIFDEFR